jgi:hypothetical protein
VDGSQAFKTGDTLETPLFADLKIDISQLFV